MLRSIYQRILDAFRTNSRRRRRAPGAVRCVRPRRLAVESLESRKLLTVTTLTFNSISDGSFEAPALPDQRPTQVRAPKFALAVLGDRRREQQ